MRERGGKGERARVCACLHDLLWTPPARLPWPSPLPPHLQTLPACLVHLLCWPLPRACVQVRRVSSALPRTQRPGPPPIRLVFAPTRHPRLALPGGPPPTRQVVSPRHRSVSPGTASSLRPRAPYTPDSVFVSCGPQTRRRGAVWPPATAGTRHTRRSCGPNQMRDTSDERRLPRPMTAMKHGKLGSNQAYPMQHTQTDDRNEA